MQSKTAEISYKRKKTRRHFSAFEIAVFVFLALLAASYLFIIGWGLLSSFKTYDDFRRNKFGLPTEWDFTNLLYVLKNFSVPTTTSKGMPITVYVPEMLLNTVLYVLGCGFISTMIPFITAYLVTKYPYKLSKIVYVFVIVAMAIPIVGAQASEMRVMMTLKLYNTRFGMWIKCGSIISMYFLVMCATFRSIPKALGEAAEVDGASQMRIMWQIIMPMALNVFGVVFLINSIAFWNEYTSALLFQPAYPTLSVGLYALLRSQDNSMSFVPRRMAACFALMIPVFILFLIFSDKMMNSLSMGGVKE